jgi:hypothetical protein
MSESETKAIYAEFPAPVAREIKVDAARQGLSMRQWLLEASLARLRPREPELAE